MWTLLRKSRVIANHLTATVLQWHTPSSFVMSTFARRNNDPWWRRGIDQESIRRLFSFIVWYYSKVRNLSPNLFVLIVTLVKLQRALHPQLYWFMAYIPVFRTLWISTVNEIIYWARHSQSKTITKISTKNQSPPSQNFHLTKLIRLLNLG